MANELTTQLNSLFEEENIGFRIANGAVTDITNPIELEAVNTALASPFAQAAHHIERALHLLYDKPPDFRNSIKEAISAVENVAKLLTGNSSTTLGAALKVLDRNSTFHPAFTEALNKLYGYTSNAEGIRHALMEDTALTHEDAKLFLIQCSAFVNFMKERAIRLKLLK